MGPTPYEQTLKVGTYQLALRGRDEKGYEVEPFTRIIRVGDKGFRLVQPLEYRKGRLTIECNEPDALVYLDDRSQPLRVSELRNYPLPAGDHTVRVTKSEYPDEYTEWTERITIQANRSERRRVNISLGVGFLLVEGTPSWAQITLDGKPLQGWQTGRVKQSIGEVPLVAHLPGYESKRSTVRIEKDREARWTFRLRPKSRWKAAGKSLVLPSWGQFYGDRPVRGSLLLLAQLASAGAAVWSHLEYTRLERDYEDAVHRYNTATRVGALLQARRDVEQTYDDLLDTFDRRQLLGIAAGAVWGLSVLDALIVGPRRYEGPSGYSVAPVAFPRGAGVAVRF